jgi:hypothetical protein
MLRDRRANDLSSQRYGSVADAAMNDNLCDYRRILAEYRKCMHFITGLFTNIVNVDKEVGRSDCRR